MKEEDVSCCPCRSGARVWWWPGGGLDVPSAPAPCVCSSLPLSLCVGISFCPTSQDTLEVCCVAWQHWDGLRGEAGVEVLGSLGIEVHMTIDRVGILLMEG